VATSTTCDILLTAHPDVSHVWQRIAPRDRGEADALVDRAACTRYVASARTALHARVDKERNIR
jgi:metallo-beta-lactamase class B